MAIYDIDGNEIVSSDADSIIKKLRSLKYHFNTTEGLNNWTTYNNYDLFTIAHISDIHNDPIRYENFLKFLYKHKTHIDIGIVTGDLVDISTVSNWNEMIAKEVYDVDLLKTVGNHEKNGFTDEQIYDNWNFVTNTGKLYYYKDYPSYNIRIISIDAFDPIEGDSHYGQTQIDWFINTLKDAKTKNYTVIVARHNVEGTPDNISSNNNGFYQRWYQWPHIVSLYNNGTLIEDIVEAFKIGGSLSGTYTFTDSTPSVSVNTSFNGNGSFACYICGHYHADLIGYSVAHPDQLYLNVAQGCYHSTTRPTIMWEQVSDMPRAEGEPSENLFNVYGIDIKNKLIKVMRVGSDVNDKMEKREMAVYQFSPTN